MRLSHFFKETLLSEPYVRRGWSTGFEGMYLDINNYTAGFISPPVVVSFFA